MPRPRTPTATLARTGALERDRKRHQGRQNEPEAAELIGEAPDFLLPAQRDAWQYIVERCPAGVLRRADEVLVVACAVLLEKILAGAASPAALTRLHGMLASMGMTPSDRSRVSVPTPAKRTRLQEAIDGPG